jgi:hypothetical protein
MWGHLSEARLLDLLEGGAAAASAAHVASCARCGERLASARSGLLLAREAGEVPEPSALYWESFRKQVDGRIDDASGGWSSGLRPALATAAALVALFALLPGSRVEREAAPERTLPRWSALPPVAEDASFALLAGVAAAEDDVAAEAARHGMADAVAELSDAEQRQLAEALHEVLRAPRHGRKS